MRGIDTKTLGSAASLKDALSGALTDAGKIVEDYAALRHAMAVPRTEILTAAKPTNARVRMAREQAALGVRLAHDGRIVPAIDRLRQSVELDPTVGTVRHDLGLMLIRAGRLQDAVEVLRGALRLDPASISAHANLANALEHLGRENEAQPAYEALVRLDPTRHDAHAYLGRIHLTNARPIPAEASFRAAAAAAVAVGSPRARLYEAHAATIGNRAQDAEALLRGVIADDPACGEAYVSLGQVLAESGQFQEAAENFQQGLALDPAMVAAWYQFATSVKFTAEHKEQMARMETCLQRPDLTPGQRQAVHFALGKAYDDLADYAMAMKHLDAANRIRGAHRSLDRALLARQTEHVIATAPRGFLTRRTDIGIDDETPILIVGMPRSGTTLVEQILSSHPDIAAGGELGFWRECNRAGISIFTTDAPVEAARRLANDYVALLRLISSGAARVIDKMPFNFAHLGVIRQVLPRATIVHCRRNPVDTCLSNFATNFQIPYDFAADRGSLVFFYRQYERLMAHWREVLPAERFIEVDYETLVADPEPITRRLVATCGLDWNDACLAPQQNRRSIATASLWQARRPIYQTSVERWRRYEPWLGELSNLLTDAATETLANQSRPR